MVETSDQRNTRILLEVTPAMREAIRLLAVASNALAAEMGIRTDLNEMSGERKADAEIGSRKPMLFTAEEVADRWKVGASTIRRMVASGELRAVRVGAKVLRFRLEDIEGLESSSVDSVRDAAISPNKEIIHADTHEYPTVKISRRRGRRS